ncbi:MAG TPA: response regulator [Burkholderiales bacterium]|nr:response regulator [Burkholderiales bacterium]
MPPLCVLIVEDNYDQAQTLRMFLGLKGHHLEVAPTGPLALDMARRCRPDVVLLDIGLPGLDGFEVARELRREYGDAIRIIAVSAYGSENDRRQSLEAGCELHLVKPADPRFIESLLG